jgi:transcriptional regulator with XRE-family HTH domain
MERTWFGTLLRQQREAAALSQDALAQRAGLSVDAISALEAGRSSAPRLETARRLCEALGLAGDERALFLNAPRSARTEGSNTLPPQPTALIGREREVAAGVQLLRRSALLTFVGPPASARPGWPYRWRQKRAPSLRMGSVSCRWRRSATRRWSARRSPRRSASRSAGGARCPRP